MYEGLIDLRKLQPGNQVNSPYQDGKKVDVSIVIPLFNENENISELYSRLNLVTSSMEKKCEIIFIDDGSTDGTLDTLKGIQCEDSRVWVIQLRRNFGQAAAFLLLL